MKEGMSKKNMQVSKLKMQKNKMKEGMNKMKMQVSEMIDEMMGWFAEVLIFDLRLKKENWRLKICDLWLEITVCTAMMKKVWVPEWELRFGNYCL